MGIDGLLKLLGPIVLKQHLSSFRGQVAVIDIMSWLYKGCYRCAYEHNQNIESNAFLYYVFEMLEILSYYNIKPIVVFDGRYVGKKGDTIEKRKKQKEDNKQKGMEWLEKGNEEEARKYLSRCIIIDDRVITLTMSALYTKGIQYLVAPYESDSQMAKLIHLGIADFAITEDSDLLMYNVKAMLKLTQDGQCDFIDLDRWTASDVDTPYLKIYLKMTPIQRVQIGVLAGSDYNSSIKGIGIKRAIKHMSERNNFKAVIQHLRSKKHYQELIPENYQSMVMDSKLIFTFATIYNPLNDRLEFFNPELLDQIKPEHMDQEDLKKIVGPFYSYDADIKLGKTNARNNQPRQITKVDIKKVFSNANKQNLNVLEVLNIRRRQMMNEMRKKREEQRASMPQNEQIQVWKKPSKPKKEKVSQPVVEISEEQRKKLTEQRKAEKIQRFSEFKNILNSFTLSSQSQSEISVSQEENNKNNHQSQNKESIKMKKSDTVVSSNKKDDFDVSDSESQSIDLQLHALNPNPWAKLA